MFLLPAAVKRELKYRTVCPEELELGQCSQYSDCALDCMIEGLILGQEIFLFSKTSRLSVGPTQSPVQSVLGVDAAGA